jgi:hypothetical protein
MTDRDTRRDALAKSLATEAARRYGDDRAAALRPVIEQAAGQLADLAALPLDVDEVPAFYIDQGLTERSPRP